MPDNADEIKAVLDSLSTSELTASARLVAVILALGIERAKDIQKLTGLSEAGARKAKAQLSDHRTGVRAPECDRTRVAHQSANSHQSSAPECASRECAPAHKESPSEIVIDSASKLASRAREEIEIEGLNGNTPMYVDWLADWLNPFAPDRQAAIQILTSNVAIYGPAKVQAGMVELKTLIASGSKPRNLAKAFPAYVKNASIDAKPIATPQSKADARHASFMAALETMEVH